METQLPYQPPIMAVALPRPPAPQLWRWHVVAFAFLIPFFILLAIHPYLGLADPLMQAPRPQPDSIHFNILMILAFYGGVCGFVLHVFVIAERVPRWMLAKLFFLAALWAALGWAYP